MARAGANARVRRSPVAALVYVWAMLRTSLLIAGVAMACKQGEPPPARHRAPPATRPAAITDTDVKVMDELAAMLTAIDTSVKAEHDCTKAALVVRDAATKHAAALAAMPAADAHARGDDDAEAWAFANYGQRIKPLMEGIIGHECASDAGFKAALAQMQ